MLERSGSSTTKKPPPNRSCGIKTGGYIYLALLLSEEFRFGMYDEGADKFAAFARLGFMVFLCLSG